MEVKHTKGPWKYHENGDANSYSILRQDNKWVIAFVQNGEILNEEQFANVKLITAAPDLLKAAQRALNFLDWMHERISEFNLFSDKRQEFYEVQGLLEYAIVKSETKDMPELKDETNEMRVVLSNRREQKRFKAACAAMQGILSQMLTKEGSNSLSDAAKLKNFKETEVVAKLAYKFADELLKQESK